MNATTSLSDLIAVKGYAVADGAMGTQLFEAGLESGDPPELWNVDHPRVIQGIHRSYFQAGADLVLTNSFGCNRFRLALHGLRDRVSELNEAAARNARLAADLESDKSERPVIVAGSMGPTGELLAPMGGMTVSECEAAFSEQAEGLVAGGVDLLWIETMSDLREVEAAVRGVRRSCDIPVAVTMSFDTAGHTMMGVSGSEMGRRLRSLGLAALGANCGGNLGDTEAAVAELASATGRPAAGTPSRAAADSSTAGEDAGGQTAVISKPNAGIPEWKGAEMSYSGTPQTMAASSHRVLEAGAAVVGACCGSSPEHIAKISAVLRGDEPVPDIAASAVSKRKESSRRNPRRRRRR